MAEEATQAVETPQDKPQLVQIVEGPRPPRNDDEITADIAAMLENEVAETTAQNTPANVQANQEPREDAPAPGADGEPTEDSAREAEADASDAPAEADSQEASDEDSVEVAETFQGLAEQLGVDESALSEHMKVGVKVDGQAKDVSLAELRASFQLESKYRQNATALAEERRAFDTERDGFVNERQQHAATLMAMFQHAEQLIAGEEQAIDPTLEHTDPEQFLIQTNAARNRRERLQALYGGLGQTQQQLAQHQQQQQGFYVQEQAQRLAELVPEWGENPEKGRKEISELRSWAAERYGFSRDEVDQNYDARTIKMIRDLRRLSDLENKVPTMKKKIAKVPKAVKPGAGRDAADRRSDAAAKTLNRLRKEGSTDAFAEHLLASGLT